MSGMADMAKGAFVAAAGATVAAVGGMTAAIGKSVSVAGNLEQQAANISAVFGNMAPPVEDVKSLINDLALDPSLVIGIEDAGAGIQMMAQNGLAWEDISNGVARSTILLANATGTALPTAVDIATNAMGIFELGVEDMDSVVATFTNAANKSQFGVEDWGYALSNAGPKAAAFGFELDDLFAAMTLTSSGFSSGMTMGTSWAWMINGLVPNTDKAANAMKELGLMTEDGSNQFFNADGTGKELTEVIRILQGAFGGLTTEQQMAYSRTIFGQEAFGALSGVLGLNNDQLAQLIPQMTDFSAVEAGAATRTNTFQGAMGALSDTINSVFAMIGDKFLPLFTEMARTLAVFVKDNAPLIVKFFGNFADGLARFVSNAGSWLSRLSSIFSLQFAILTSDNAAWGEKLLAVWDMLYTVGLTLWQSLLDGIVKLLPQWLDSFVEWAKSLWQWIVDATPQALAALWEWAKGLWGWLVDNLPTWAANLWEWAKATWAWIVEVTPKAVEELGKWADTIFGWLGDNLPDLVTTLLGWGTALWKWIGEAVPNAINGLAGFIASLRGEGDGAGLSSIGQMVAGWATRLWNWITLDALPKIAPAFVEFVGAVWAAGGNILIALGKLAVEFGRTLWFWIVEASPIVVQKLNEWGVAIGTWLTTNLPVALQPLGAWTTGLFQWIANAIPSVVTTLGEWGTAIWGWLTTNGQTLTTTLASWGWALVSFIGAIGKAVIAIGTIFAPIATAIARFVTWKDVLVGAAVTMGVIFAPAVVGAIAAALAPIAGFIAAWAPVLLIFAAATLASAALRTAWETDWGGIRTTTGEAIGYLQARFGPLVTTIRDFGVEALTEIAAWATGTETDFSAVNTIVNSAKTTFGLLWTDFETRFPETAAVIDGAWITVSNSTKTAFDYVSEKTSGLTQAITDFGVDSLIEIGKWATGQDTEFTATTTIWNEFKDTVTAVKDDFIANVMPPVIEMFRINFPGSVKATTKAMELLAESWAIMNTEIGGELDTTERDFSAFFDALKRLMDSGLTLMILRTSTFVANLGLAFAALGAAATGDWDMMWKSLNKIQENEQIAMEAEARFNLNALTVMWESGGREVVGGFKDGVSQAQNGSRQVVGDFGQDMIDEFRDKFDIQSPSRVFEGFGKNVVAGFEGGFDSRWQQFKNHTSPTVNGWVSWFKGIFGIHSPSTVFEDYGTNIVAGLARGIEGASSMVYDAMGGISTGLTMEAAYAASYAGGDGVATSSNVNTSRIEELLTILIAELRAKNMSANVTVAGGDNYGMMAGYLAGARR